MFPSYDVIVVGAGHAGCEAASAAATGSGISSGSRCLFRRLKPPEAGWCISSGRTTKAIVLREKSSRDRYLVIDVINKLLLYLLWQGAFKSMLIFAWILAKWF